MKRLLCVLCTFISISVFAQTIEPDSEIIKGRLDNGLTYYIVHNENPAGFADFFIAHNVGALEEADNEDGLAHFLEHLAFNGLKHFPDKAMLEYLARDGVRFGYNVNAYTSRYETVYNIDSVPLQREAFVDSVLLVVRDWADGITCDTDAVRAEAGVINEEWRLRTGDQRRRMAILQDGLLYGSSKQARRTVLGNMDVINAATGDTLLNFYHSWYRPDLQAVIVVGDVDVLDMEGKIRSIFGDLSSPAGAKAKEAHPLKPLSAVKVGTMADNDARYTVAKIMHYVDQPAFDYRSSYEAVKTDVAYHLASSALSARLKDRMQDENSPLSSAVSVLNQNGRDLYLNLVTCGAKSGFGLHDVLVVAQREVERLLRYGITADELANAKIDLIKKGHLQVIEQGSETNADLVKTCLNNFLKGAPLVKDSKAKEIRRDAISEVTIEDVSAAIAKLFGSHGIYASCLNTKDLDKALSEAEVLTIIDSLTSATIEPKPCEFSHMSIDVAGTPGKIISSKRLPSDRRVKLWTLSNGARVYYLHVDSLRRSSRVCARYVFENGGVTSLDLSDKKLAKLAVTYIDKSVGMRGTDRRSLMLQPELIDASYLMSIKDRNSYVSVTAPSLDKAFKVATIQLTEPYFGSAQEMNAFKKRELKNIASERSPRNDFNQELRLLLDSEAPLRGVELDTASVEALNVNFIRECYSRAFGDISGMTLYLVSDYPEEEVRACVEQYVASLQSTATKVSVAQKPSRAPQIEESKTITRSASAKDTPFALVAYDMVAPVKFDASTLAKVEVLDYVMSQRCLNKIREERGGTYHVGFTTEVYPKMKEGTHKMRQAVLVSDISFQTRVELRDILLQDAKDILAEMAAQGPTSEELDEALTYLRKRFRMRSRSIETSASAWESRLYGHVDLGRPLDLELYRKALSKVSASDVQSLARQLSKGVIIEATYTEE